MKIHYIQHVPFETPQAIKKWADDRGHDLTGTHLFNQEAFPSLDQFDWLFVLGGPMGVHDEEEYQWLKPEKEFIKKAIDANKVVVGICLGAQLIADVLGAVVHKHHMKEIGWFPVSLTPLGWDSPIFSKLPATFEAFHWHGDTFRIPKGALHIASSECCPNQAFIYGDRVIGLQFHIETMPEGVKALMEKCAHEFKEESEYIQEPDKVLEQIDKCAKLNETLFLLLDSIKEAVKE